MQHDDTLMAMELAGLSAWETWMHYCNMGGAAGYFDFDAYLHGIVDLDAEDADVVSQAVNELIDDVPSEESRVNRAPYSWTGCPAPSAAGRGDDGVPAHDLILNPGIPLPPGSPRELLGEILGRDMVGRPAAGGRA